MTRLIALIPIAFLAACSEGEIAPDAAEGAVLYGEYCAACHGADATGGPAVAGAVPPDLTRLAARNGGDFPMAYVMSTIDGYARDDTHGPMPRFGDLIESETITWVDRDGTPTPTPAALVALGTYLRGLQVQG